MAENRMKSNSEGNSPYARKRKLKVRLCKRLGISPEQAPPITYLKEALRGEAQ
jgi:hypothetical protein